MAFPTLLELKEKFPDIVTDDMGKNEELVLGVLLNHIYKRNFEIQPLKEFVFGVFRSHYADKFTLHKDDCKLSYENIINKFVMLGYIYDIREDNIGYYNNPNSDVNPHSEIVKINMT